MKNPLINFSHLIILLLVSGYAMAQFETFQKSYGETGDEKAYSIKETLDRGKILVGVTKSWGSRTKIMAVKLDSSDQLLWTKIYGGNSGIDIAKDVVATADGGTAIVGTTTSYGVGKKDLLLLKLDKDGNPEWAKTYGGEYNDYGFKLKQTLDGGYVMVGESSSFGASSSDVYVVKVNPFGKLQWSKLLGGKAVEFGYGVFETHDGYVLSSETNSFGAGSWDVSLIKLDKKGEILWYNTYGGPKDDFGYDMIQTKDEGYALVGTTSSYGMGSKDFYMIKTDKEGNIQWSKCYGMEHHDQCHAVYQTLGGYVLIGFSNSFTDQLNGEDVYVVRISSTGRLKWSKVYGGRFGDYGLCLTTTRDGGILVAGESSSFNGREDSDMYYLKMTDNVKSRTCEVSLAISQSINADFVSSKLDQKSVDITPEVTDVNIGSKEVLAAENIICLDDIQIIESRRGDE